MMEVISTVNFENMCRACLLQDCNTKSMNTDNTGLLNMFASLLNVEIESLNHMSTHICNSCQIKLKLSYNFQQQCKESNTRFIEYADRYKNKVEIIPPLHDEIAKVLDDGIKYDSDSTSTDNSKLPQRHYSVRKLRLAQFPYEEVQKAIKELRKSFLENVECIMCGFIGSNSRSLAVHVSHVHKEIKHNWCSECNKLFDNLGEHLKTHKGTTGLSCQFCEKNFNTRSHLIEHVKGHSVIKRYNCDVCLKSFVSARRLRTHMRVHSKEKPYECSFCTKSFSQISLLRNHLKKQHEIHKCNMCLKVFQEGESLKTHLKEHSKDENFCAYCNVVIKEDCEKHWCNYDYDVKEEIVEEIESDGIANNILLAAQNFCTLCNKRIRSLPLHNEQFHKASDDTNPESLKIIKKEKHLCTVCGKQFKAFHKLTVHMRIHTGEAPYECSFCNKRMSTRGTLVVHERIHTGEKPHVCHVCGKRFTQSNILNTHMKLHTGRTEICNICNKKFCRPSELKLHLQKHTGEKPYLCTECGQAFGQRSHLVEHTKIHSDSRPYQCTYCERAFKQKSSLKSHIQIHLGYKPFKCSQCPYASRQGYKLTHHMKTHIEDAPQSDCPYMCTICNRGFSTRAMLMSHSQKIHHITEINSEKECIL